jgi:hypothetical protein
MHGGAAGSGAPTGKHNGSYRHGRFTAEALAAKRELRNWQRASRQWAASICWEARQSLIVGNKTRYALYYWGAAMNRVVH